jgi:hypothetical protein
VTAEQLIGLVLSGGFPGLVILITWTGFAGRWRWGREFEAMEAEKNRQIVALTTDRDYWKTMAVDLMRNTEQMTQITGVAVGRRRQQG